MNTSRDKMYAELKHEVIPALRELRFKGSLPHLHRIGKDNHIDLLTFQFALGGGSFVVEIGFADPGRENVYVKKQTVASKLRVSQTTIRRRLGAADDSSDFWFTFDGDRPFGITGEPRMLAEAVRNLIHSQAIPWWNSKRTTCR